MSPTSIWSAERYLDWLVEAGSDVGDEVPDEDEDEDAMPPPLRTPSVSPPPYSPPPAYVPLPQPLPEVPHQADGLPAINPIEIPLELPDHPPGNEIEPLDIASNMDRLAAWLAQQHEIFADLVINPNLNVRQQSPPRAVFDNHVRHNNARSINPIPHSHMRKMVHSWTTEGVKLKLRSDIRATRTIQTSTYVPKNTKVYNLIEAEIKSLFDKGLISRVSKRFVKYSMPLFPVPKSSQDKENIRLVYDARELNKLLSPPPFNLPTIPSSLKTCPKGYGFVCDISSGYHHVPLHPSAKPFLCFQWRGTFFCWNVLPFGLSTAPWIFQTWLSSYISDWKKNNSEKNIFSRQYIDDIFVANKSKSIALMLKQSLLDYFAQHGIIAHPSKTSAVSSKLKYLGYLVDLLDGTVSLTDGRMAQIRRITSVFNSNTRLPRKFVEKYLGLINWCRAGSKEVLARIKPLYKELRATSTYFVKFPWHSVDDVVKLLERKVNFRYNTQPYNIYTDATLLKGAYIAGNKPSNFLIPPDYSHSSYEAEFFAVMTAINNNLHHHHIRIFCDNLGVCYTLKKGTSNHVMINSILPRFWNRVESRQVKISVVWIPSEQNPADYYSRSALLSRCQERVMQRQSQAIFN